MATALIDTNVFSEIMRERPAASVLDFFGKSHEFLTSTIVFHELDYGVNILVDGKRKTALQTFVETWKKQFEHKIIAVDLVIAGLAARLRASEARSGRTLEPFDALIAATALDRGIALATRNARHFRYLGVELIDPWRQPSAADRE